MLCLSELGLAGGAGASLCWSPILETVDREASGRTLYEAPPAGSLSCFGATAFFFGPPAA